MKRLHIITVLALLLSLYSIVATHYWTEMNDLAQRQQQTITQQSAKIQQLGTLVKAQSTQLQQFEQYREILNQLTRATQILDAIPAE